ncbi:MAG: transglutaminase-like domain-containing protein [Brevefilum fermentans]|jgi:transglutaminase-like putative cysteine protease|nr:transglutaminase-like domain-containing protein [Brevefilum fermentans]
MSTLYYSEQGFVSPNNCEEINYFRRAFKSIILPETNTPAELFILARPHDMGVPPLKILVNGQLTLEIKPEGNEPAFRWYKVTIPESDLLAGRNSFQIWSDGSGMNAWTIAFDQSIDGSQESYLSLDAGSTKTWRNKGRTNQQAGEYVLRIRIDEGQDPEPPRFAWEPPDHPRLAYLRNLIPEEIKSSDSLMTKVHQLSTWVASSFEYRSSALASLYTPWDAETILAWGKTQKGQNGQLPIVMCVHYAIVYITACQSLGIKSRPAVFTEDLGGFNGHFAAETWIPNLNKWIFVDPNLDAIFYQNDEPMTVSALKSYEDWKPFVRFGKGFDYQKKNPAIEEFMNIYLNGRFAKKRAIWSRADFLAHPELTPPGHGSLAYCETDLIWQNDASLAMFPYHVDQSYFDQPSRE